MLNGWCLTWYVTTALEILEFWNFPSSKNHTQHLVGQHPTHTHATMPYDEGQQMAVVITTSLATFVGGFLLGVYSIRGYLLSPELVAERRAALGDPVESDESDIDESDTLLDHAPSWANGPQADRRQGLSASAPAEQKPAFKNSKEECKLVLVVRTDLGMTKGTQTSSQNPCSSPLPPDRKHS